MDAMETCFCILQVWELIWIAKIIERQKRKRCVLSVCVCVSLTWTIAGVAQTETCHCWTDFEEPPASCSPCPTLLKAGT